MKAQVTVVCVLVQFVTVELLNACIVMVIPTPGMFHEGYYYVVTEREHYLQDMAPECLWEKRYSVWSDVWSFGILAYKVVALENIPYPDATVNDLYDRMVGGERPQLLASFSNEM